MRPILILLLSALLAACAQNPVSGGTDFVMMSEQQEIALGQRNDAEVRKQYPPYDDPALQDYVNRVGQRIAAHSHRAGITYHFTVLDSPEVNAFALPGGYVYITRGIMAYLNSEAELAAVLGHEIGHVTARHGVRQQSAALAADLGLTVASIFIPELNNTATHNLANLLGGALLSGYGREHELEADRLGAEYLANTEYDPQAIIRVIKVLKAQELMDAELARKEGREPRRYHGLFATHPDNDTRLHQAVDAAQRLADAPAHVERQLEYLAATDGMTYDQTAKEGVVRGQDYYHADLGFALSFPAGWQIHNSSDRLYANSTDQTAVLELSLEKGNRLPPETFARRLAGPQANIQAAHIHGLPAALIDLPRTSGACIQLGESLFILRAEFTPPAARAQHENSVQRAFGSFHRLDPSEAVLARPLHLRVITARAGEHYRDLAQGSPLGADSEIYLRLINADYPQGTLSAGRPVKIVE